MCLGSNLHWPIAYHSQCSAFTCSYLVPSLHSSLSLQTVTGVQFPTPTIIFTSFPPGNPTPTPAVQNLKPGQVFADPGRNPFARPSAFIYVPLNTTTFGSANLTGPPVLDRDDPCQLGIPVHGLLDRWGKHHMEVVHPNMTTQRVGFSVDVFKQGEAQGPALSEIAKGIALQFNCRGNNRSGGVSKRWIFPPDGRLEIFNTWVFPFYTVGRTTSDIFGCSGTWSFVVPGIAIM